eukprot:Blabericola_migrator_1__4288@NODE_2316_length_2947_cov_117_596528_g1452_i0_p2_GENE_NODE_2316_length_2947_cov_117_596528_g1452_i0NODE_2316_length_2947_cov_117_596528_g1452_i0_p2_ORF_typecomplete_len237_score49_91KH_8/PF17903_1/4_7e31KH_1/PF00013_29/8_3e03KH_1/PF00013_29/0_012_NODE_2316_length_2947_cov_117_596528_g1452_i064774
MTTDFWKQPEFDESEVKHEFVEESDFKILFPEHRSQYIQEEWPRIKDILQNVNLKCDLDLVQKVMTVATTNKTRDPFKILKGRDMLKLISRSVPLHQAKRVLETDVCCEVIRIGGMVRDKERFARRRQRLVGPAGSTLKVIELLTDTYVCISGQTVSVIGSWKGIKQVRKIVLDCMNNIHPIYQLKTLMVKEELQKDQNMQEVDWERYLPHFKKSSSNKKPAAGGKKGGRKRKVHT